MFNKVSLILSLSIIAIVVISFVLFNKNNKTNEMYNSSLIGRRGDTIKVYAIEPRYVKVKELVKLGDSWYLYGDTCLKIDEVEIIQLDSIKIKSLKFRLKDEIYKYESK